MQFRVQGFRGLGFRGSCSYVTSAFLANPTLSGQSKLYKHMDPYIEQKTPMPKTQKNARLLEYFRAVRDQQGALLFRRAQKDSCFLVLIVE